MDPLEPEATIELQGDLHDALGIAVEGRRPAHQGLQMIQGVIAVPGLGIDLLPLGLCHAGMGGADVLQVVAVEIRLQGRALVEERLMVRRARQGRQAEEFQDVQRQFPLDSLDVGKDGLWGVVREAEDVATIGGDPLALPGEEHVPVVGELVLLLVGGLEIVRVHRLQADEDPGDPRRPRLGDEAGQGVAHGVHLDGEIELDPQFLAQGDDAIEDGFPIAVAGKIVVGDEVVTNAMGQVGAQQRLDVIRIAKARLAALDVDDGAETAQEGTAASGIEGPGHGGVAPRHFRRQVRQRLPL